MNRFALPFALSQSLVAFPGLVRAQADNSTEVLRRLQEVRAMMYPMVDKDPQIRAAYDRLGKVPKMLQSGRTSSEGQAHR